MNGTIIGSLAILIWAASLPIVRIFEEQIGALGLIGATFVGAGMLGVINQILQGTKFPGKKVFFNPFLYGRWLFFVLHEALILSSIMLVKKENVPLVILINYFWPTAVILCSILFAGVKISRWWVFILGSVIVLTSLSIEILGPKGISVDLIENATDRLAYAMAFMGAVSWGLYCAPFEARRTCHRWRRLNPFLSTYAWLGIPAIVYERRYGLGQFNALVVGIFSRLLCHAIYSVSELGLRHANGEHSCT